VASGEWRERKKKWRVASGEWRERKKKWRVARKGKKNGLWLVARREVEAAVTRRWRDA
jgi:hypothetical protein